MKIALLLHGLTRRYDISYPFIKKNIIDKFNADVFISCWENEVPAEDLNKGQNLPLQGLIDLYQPKAYDFEIYNNEVEEKFINPKYSQLFPDIDTHYKNVWARLFAFYYKVWKVNKLKNDFELKNHIKYDIVIKWRTDVFINDVLNIDLLNNINKDNDSVYMPFGHGGDNYINDLIYIAKPDIMNKICELYHNLENVSEIVAPQLSYEKHLLIWLSLNNIHMKHFYIDWQYITFRPEFKIRTLNANNILNVNI